MTSDIRRTLLLLVVFVAVAMLALWALPTADLAAPTNRLATRWELVRALTVRLAPALGVAAVAAGVSAWVLSRGERVRTAGRLRDALESLNRVLETDASVEESGDPASQVRRAADRAADRLARLESDYGHLSTVLGSMSEGVLVVDVEGRTVMVNRSWRELFGVTGDVQGRTVLEVTRQAELDRMIGETLDSHQGRQIELQVTLGRRLTLVLTSSPLTDGAGVVVLANDLTPFLRVGEIRRDFVANVSHELKTPLSAIRGFAETLSDGALADPDAAGRFIERILKQCQRLEALLSDLLTLSRLEHPAARTGWGETDMAELLSEAIDLTRPSAAERTLEIVAEIGLVPKFDGDSEALFRMCLNLLENAIKYNRPGGRIEARLLATAGRIVLEVADTGIGIPSESIDRLFERFYRVDKGRSRNEGGTGLGLAIVKHAAQLHAGSVAVESELGKGTRFRVTLPVA